MQNPINPFWSTVIEESPRQGNMPGNTFPQSNVQVEKTNWILENLNPAINQLLLEVNNIKESITNQVVQIYDLSNPKYLLKSSIPIVISYENGTYYAETADFDIYSEGNDIKEALDNIKVVIISHYESLNKHKRKLSKKMRHDFIVLSKLIKHEK